jgi:hypothetical protein
MSESELHKLTDSMLSILKAYDGQLCPNQSADASNDCGDSIQDSKVVSIDSQLCVEDQGYVFNESSIAKE